MPNKPYWSKKATGKTLHQLKREEDFPFPESNNYLFDLERGKEIDTEYRPVCEAKGKIYVRGHTVKLDDGRIIWKVGYCRKRRR